jgi:hypothetical protein
MTNNSKELSDVIHCNREDAYQTKGKISHRQAITNKRFKRLMAKADRLESHKILLKAINEYAETEVYDLWSHVLDFGLDPHACSLLDRLENFGFNSICNDAEAEEICPAYEDCESCF